MAAAAKKKMQARIPRGRLVAQAALVALLLGASWVAVAFHIAELGGPCLAVEGSVWLNTDCREMMTFASAVAVVSLLLVLWLCCREAQAEAQIREAQAAGGAQDAVYLPELGLAVGPESRLLRDSDATATSAIFIIHLLCVVTMFMGFVIKYIGSQHSLQYPADTEAHGLVKVGILAFWFELCCLAIPYTMLRLRRFVRANWARSSSA